MNASSGVRKQLCLDADVYRIGDEWVVTVRAGDVVVATDQGATDAVRERLRRLGIRVVRLVTVGSLIPIARIDLEYFGKWTAPSEQVFGRSPKSVADRK